MISWNLGPEQEYKRAVRRVNVSVAIVLLLIGYESLLVASVPQPGESVYMLFFPKLCSSTSFALSLSRAHVHEAYQPKL